MINLTQDNFLPRNLGKWLKKSHDNKMWSYDEKNEKLIAQQNRYYWMFEKLHTSERRPKEDKFIYRETRSNYMGVTVSTTIY